MQIPNNLIAYLESMPEPHIVCDRHYTIVAANAAYRRQYGDGKPLVGRRCHEASHHSPMPCDQAGETCPLAQARISRQREQVLHLHHTPHGKVYVRIELVPLHDASGALHFFVEKMETLPVSQGQAGQHTLVGESSAFRHMLDLVARVAPSQASVLLRGESGTGKEGVAHAIHAASHRQTQPIVVVDCASLAESLFESELFGHEKGAFTGASHAKPGLVEAANSGTLFLDEVGDIPLGMQVKLLRLLEAGTYRRVGSTDLRHVDVRVVAATHRNLRDMVAAGTFREDLYYRLATFPIRLPPLRERAEDIPLIARSLLVRIAPLRPLSLTPQAMALLQLQPWPGNVRELRNVLERATLLTEADAIEAAILQQALLADAPQPSPLSLGSAALPLPGALPAAAPLALAPGTPPRSLRAIEEEALVQALHAHRGRRTELARALGISERTLYRRLKALEASTTPLPPPA